MPRRCEYEPTYSTSLMLGLNQRLRKTPVSSRITKLHRAISPSRNDQWSGKTLRSCFFARPPSPTRSSSHSTGLVVPLREDAVALVLIDDHPRSQKLGPTGS